MGIYYNCEAADYYILKTTPNFHRNLVKIILNALLLRGFPLSTWELQADPLLKQTHKEKVIRGHINRFYTEVTLGKLKNNIFDLKTTCNSYMKISVFFFFVLFVFQWFAEYQLAYKDELFEASNTAYQSSTRYSNDSITTTHKTFNEKKNQMKGWLRKQLRREHWKAPNHEILENNTHQRQNIEKIKGDE